MIVNNSINQKISIKQLNFAQNIFQAKPASAPSREKTSANNLAKPSLEQLQTIKNISFGSLPKKDWRKYNDIYDLFFDKNPLDLKFYAAIDKDCFYKLATNTNKKGNNSLHKVAHHYDYGYTLNEGVRFIETLSEADIHYLMGVFDKLITQKNNRGNTPIHTAVIYGSHEILEKFTKCGRTIKENIKNNNGDTPVDLAIKTRDKVTLDILEDGGLKPMHNLNEYYSEFLSRRKKHLNNIYKDPQRLISALYADNSDIVERIFHYGGNELKEALKDEKTAQKIILRAIKYESKRTFDSIVKLAPEEFANAVKNLSDEGEPLSCKLFYSMEKSPWVDKTIEKYATKD